MFKRLFGAQSSSSLPSGSLKSEEIDVQILSHYGVPEHSSVLAYDHIHSVLAIGTRNGVIKIYGGEGVETSFYSPSASGSKYLEFSSSKGLLINVNLKNEIEIWSLETKELVSSAKTDAVITAFFLLPDSPYIYLGSDYGTLLVAQFDSNQIRILPFTLPLSTTLEGLESEVSKGVSLVGILSHPEAKFNNLLLAYSNGIILLWNLKDSRIECLRGGSDEINKKLINLYNAKYPSAKISESKKKASKKSSIDLTISDKVKLLSVTWICPHGKTLAAGYDSGELIFWDIGFNLSDNLGQKFVSRIPISKVKFDTDATGSNPVSKLLWCNGLLHNLSEDDEDYKLLKEELENEKKQDNELSGLLFVLEGGSSGKISALSLKDSSADDSKKMKQLPWFGTIEDFILLKDRKPNPNYYSSLAVLSYPAVIQVFDKLSISSLLSDKPESFHTLTPHSLPFLLKTPSITATHTSVVLESDGLWEDLNTIKLSSYEYPTVLFSGLEWPFRGGKRIKTASGRAFDKSLYFIGLNDGFVHIFDVKKNQLSPFLSVPSKEDYLNQVSKHEFDEIEAIDFCPKSGLLVVSHGDGLVRFYVYSNVSKLRTQFLVTKESTEKVGDFHFNPGFQCVAIFKINEYKVKTINLSTGFNRLCFGDENGNVTLVDIKNLKILKHFPCFFTTYASILSIKSCIIKVPTEPIPSSTEKSKKKLKVVNEEKAVIFITNRTMHTTVCDLRSSELVENSFFQPLDDSDTLKLALLKEDGSAIDSFKSFISLKWVIDIQDAEEGQDEKTAEIVQEENGTEEILLNQKDTEGDTGEKHTIPKNTSSEFIRDKSDRDGDNLGKGTEEDKLKKIEPNETSDSLQEKSNVEVSLLKDFDAIDNEDEEAGTSELNADENVEKAEKEKINIVDVAEGVEEENAVVVTDGDDSKTIKDENEVQQPNSSSEPSELTLSDKGVEIDTLENETINDGKIDQKEEIHVAEKLDVGEENNLDDENDWIFEPSTVKNFEPDFVFLIGVHYAHIYHISQILNPEHSELKRFELFEKKNAYASFFGSKDKVSPGAFLISNEGNYEIRSVPDFTVLQTGNIFSNVFKSFDKQIDYFISKVSLGSLFRDGTFLLFPSDFEIVSGSLSSKLVLDESNLILFDPSKVEEYIEEVKKANEAAAVIKLVPEKSTNFFSTMINTFKSSSKPTSIPHVELTLEELNSILSSRLPSLSSSHEIEEVVKQEEIPPKKQFNFSNPVDVQSRTEFFAPKKKESDKYLKRSKTSLSSDSVAEAPKQRTAEEIKALYGRAIKPKNDNDMASVLNQTQEKLALRGQKLQNLGDMTDQLSDAANTFAELAAQIEKKQKEKKWWQL